MPHDVVIDGYGLPLPRVERRLLTRRDASETHTRDAGLQDLVAALEGVQATASLLGISRHDLRDIVLARRPMTLAMVDRLIELARERSVALAAVAVRLETHDKPVLIERRRLLTERRRAAFRERFGYLPEENQVMKRQKAPS